MFGSLSMQLVCKFTHSISVEVHEGRASSLLIISKLFFVDIMQ